MTSVTTQRASRFLCSMIACMLTQVSTAAHIVFDLGGVLLEQNYEQALGQFELSKFDYLWYMLTTGNNPRTRLFDIFNTIEPQINSTYAPSDEQGHLLPSLMRYWQQGQASPEEIRDYILAYCENNPGLLKNPLEKKIFTHMVIGMFTPCKFASMQQWNPDGLGFLKACKQQGHSVYILSNWDAGSFAVMCTRPYFRDIFDLFDGIMISGWQHCTKPDPEFYTRLLTTYNLDPADTIFIDDQPVNVEAARTVGITGIVCPQARYTLAPWATYPDFAYVREQYVKKTALIAAAKQH